MLGISATVRCEAVAWVSLLGVATFACQPGPRKADAFLATRVPTAHLDSVIKAADSVPLPLGDARLLMGAVLQAGFGAKLPHDTMTIAEILTWARTAQARRDSADAEATRLASAERAREEQLRQELDSVLTVAVVSKGFLGSDLEAGRYEDFITLTFAYQNKGTKAIRAFRGSVIFLDVFGDTIYSAGLKVDDPLGPGQTRRESGRTIKYNQFMATHQRLRNTELSNMKIIWQPTDVIFADGTKLSVTEDSPSP